MDIKGKIILFPEQKKDKEGNTFISCSTSISRVRDGGNPLHKSFRVYFDKKNFPDEKLAKLDQGKYYLFEVKEGWLSLEAYKNKAGEEVVVPVVWIRDGKITEAHDKKPAEAKGEDLPF